MNDICAYTERGLIYPGYVNISADADNREHAVITVRSGGERFGGGLSQSQASFSLPFAELDKMVAAYQAKRQPPDQVQEQPAQSFGIIDPDYARVFTQARIVAWQYGYACLAHGSFTRDLDLLLVPWTEHATREMDSFIKHLASVTGLKLHQAPASDKPHGRKAWTLLFPGFEDVRWVDVSALPLQQPAAQVGVGAAEC